MAVRKSEPADSIVDARISVDAPMPVPPASSTERAANERRRATEAFDSDTRIWSFNLRLMRAGAALLVAFEAIYFIIDSDFPPALTPAAVASVRHHINIHTTMRLPRVSHRYICVLSALAYTIVNEPAQLDEVAMKLAPQAMLDQTSLLRGLHRVKDKIDEALANA